MRNLFNLPTNAKRQTPNAKRQTPNAKRQTPLNLSRMVALAILFSSFAFLANAQNLFSPGGTIGSSFGPPTNPSGVSIRSPFAWFPFQVWDGATPGGSFYTNPYTGVGIDPGNNPSEIAQIISVKNWYSGLLINAGSQDSGRGQTGIFFGTGDNVTNQKVTQFARTFDFNFLAYADKLEKTTLAGIGTGTTVGTKVVTIDDIAVLGVPQGPHLRVLGGIKAKKITVTQNVWADYVFADGFKLRPLAEVATFIGKNKHLPDVPSQTEITTNGLDLGEMQKIHMQKIEELTLYLLEQEKRIQLLEQKLLQLSEKK